MPKQVTEKNVQNFMNSDLMKKVLSHPLPKDVKYIWLGDEEFPGCPPGCECPTDKGCGYEPAT
jgi:hypothetical protein